MGQKSPIDELYFRLMGSYPTKAGTAYEIISSAVLSLIVGKGAEHNVYKKGLSGTTYQLDGLLHGNIMIEAKDYTIQNSKVGRGELQKLQGGLTDLPDIEKGIFTTATEFTSDAKKYAAGTTTNNLQKEIIPATIRRTSSDDMANRIQSIEIEIIIKEPDYSNGKYSIIWATGEQERFSKNLRAKGKNFVTLRLQEFYDSEGNYLACMEEISAKQQPSFELDSDIQSIEGSYEIDAYVKMDDELYAIKGIKYNIPIVCSTDSFTIKSDGSPEMLVDCKVLGINKIITDSELKTAISRIIGYSNHGYDI